MLCNTDVVGVDVVIGATEYKTPDWVVSAVVLVESTVVRAGEVSSDCVLGIS